MPLIDVVGEAGASGNHRKVVSQFNFKECFILFYKVEACGKIPLTLFFFFILVVTCDMKW